MIEKITLCGSTRFMPMFHQWNSRLTKKGYLVYSVAMSMHGHEIPTPEEKLVLDKVHLRKIDSSDAVLILNVGGYIGDSTRNELRHARETGKLVFFLEGHMVNPTDWLGDGSLICLDPKADPIAESIPVRQRD